MKRHIPCIILIILLLASVLFNFFNNNKETIVKEVYRDTIIVTQRATDTIYFERFKYARDTILRKDTIFIHDTLTDVYHYKDSTIDIDVKAKDLEWLKYSIHLKDTLSLKDNYIYIKEKYKPKFYYGLGVGYGYGLIHNKSDIFVGISVGLNF